MLPLGKGSLGPKCTGTAQTGALNSYRRALTGFRVSLGFSGLSSEYLT